VWCRYAVVALSLSACNRGSNPAAQARGSSASSAQAAPSPLKGGIALVTPTAFDVVPSPSGATLVFVEAGPRRTVRLELDASGTVKGTPYTAFDGSAMSGEPSDLGAAWVGSALALAWVERVGPKARVRAAWARPDAVNAAAPPKVLELGSAWVGPRTARGNLVVAARGDRALVFARGEETACVDPGQKSCFGFAFHELEGERAVPTGLPLTVPVPCTDHSAMLAVVGDRFHYGVCTDTGTAPMTTLFTIERNPEYARADRLLEGCKPSGTLIFGGAAWLVGDCQGSRRAVRVAGRNDPLEFIELRTARLECAADGARLRASGFDLVLDEPRAGLEAALPVELAPAGSRATWSGRALVVASTGGGALGVTRHRCDGGRLAQEAVALPTVR
jgi:hypothetical protein